MEGAIFDCPAAWGGKLPPGVQSFQAAGGLKGTNWDILALTGRGCREAEAAVRCRILLSPGNSAPPVQAGAVITYGLSPRDSLTLSSLAEPVLCVQRRLPRPDGTEIEPQEFPLSPLPGPAEELLPLLGLRLLLMPLTEPFALW